MSLKEQLIEDMDAKFLSNEGILRLVEKVSCEEREVFGKIEGIISRKRQEYRKKQTLDEIQKSIKIEIFETPRANIKEGEIYCLICSVDYYYSIYYIKEVTNNDEYIGFSRLGNFNAAYRYLLTYQNFQWHKVIDLSLYEEVNKQINR